MIEVKLTIEQEFQIVAFSKAVEYMTREEAQENLIGLFRMMKIREIMYQKILGQSWGIS